MYKHAYAYTPDNPTGNYNCCLARKFRNLPETKAIAGSILDIRFYAPSD